MNILSWLRSLGSKKQAPPLAIEDSAPPPPPPKPAWEYKPGMSVEEVHAGADLLFRQGTAPMPGRLGADWTEEMRYLEQRAQAADREKAAAIAERDHYKTALEMAADTVNKFVAGDPELRAKFTEVKQAEWNAQQQADFEQVKQMLRGANEMIRESQEKEEVQTRKFAEAVARIRYLEAQLHQEPRGDSDYANVCEEWREQADTIYTLETKVKKLERELKCALDINKNAAGRIQELEKELASWRSGTQTTARRLCLGCQKPLQKPTKPKRGNPRLYCSDACRNRTYRKPVRPTKPPCPECGKPVPPGTKGQTRTYCSDPCRKKAKSKRHDAKVRGA